MRPCPSGVPNCPVFKRQAKWCKNDEDKCNLYFSFGIYMQNYLVQNLVEELIAKFDDKSWIPPTHKKYNERWAFISRRSNSNFKLYHWPDITFSENGSKFNVADKDTDFLGCYENVMHRIIFYTNTIEECAEAFVKSDIAKELEADFFPYGFEDWEEQDILKHKINYFISVITTVVLLHETAHWLVHWLPDTEFQNYSKFRNEQKEENDFHEGIAQLFTWWIVKDFQPMAIFFTWLNTYHQTERYRLYFQIAEFEVQDVIACLRLIKMKSQKIKDREEPIYFDYQNWENFCKEINNIVKMKGSKDDTEFTEEQKYIQEELCRLAKSKKVKWDIVETYISETEFYNQRGIRGLQEFGF